MVKYRRIKIERVKKYAIASGLVGTPLAIVLFLFLQSLGAITITGYSGDMTCSGTPDDLCYAYLNFTANTDVYIYPDINNSWMFSTDKKLKLLKLQRSWGTGWRTIYLNKTWNSKVKYAIKFSKGKDYKIRFVAEKINPRETLKWSFGEIDPYWFGINWTIENNKVYFNDSKVYLSAEPHTLQSSGEVYFNLTSKLYSGNIDAVWGFDTETVKPKKAELFKPHNISWNTSHSFFMENISNIEITSESCEIGNEYNTFKRNGTYQFICGYNNATNETIYNTTSKIVCFDSFEQSGTNYTIFYHTEHIRLENWIDVSHKFDSVNYEYGGMTKWWYVKNLTIQEGKNYQVRVTIDIPISLEGSSGKYWWAVKPSGETIGQAINLTHFYYLDPWWNSSWDYKREIPFYNTAGVLTDYQVKITLNTTNFNYSHANATGKDIRFTNSSDDSLDYWIETWNATGESNIWVEVNSLANATNTSIYMYYGNSGASSGSNFDNTFTKDYGESGLIVLWHLDTGSGTIVTDSSGGNNGTITNAVWNGSDGGQWDSRSDVQFSIGDSLYLDGTGDYARTDSAMESLDDFTLCGWFKRDTTIGEDYYFSLGYKNADSLVIWWQNSHGDGTNLEYYANHGTNPTNIFTNLHLTNDWDFVAIIRSGTNLTGYVNGVSQSFIYADHDYTITQKFEIGYSVQRAKSGSYFEGNIDEARVYNRALTLDELKTLYERRKYTSPEPTYTIGAEETSGDTTNPTSNSPSDASYVQNSAQTIGWILQDETGVGNYTILRNGSIQNASTSWVNNTNLGVWVNTSTIGNNWNYTILFNDSSGNEGTQDSVFINITSADTCTYTSGNWAINCSDNCSFVNTDVGGNNVTISGNGGTAKWIMNITNYTNFVIKGGCTTYAKDS